MKRKYFLIFSVIIFVILILQFLVFRAFLRWDDQQYPAPETLWHKIKHLTEEASSHGIPLFLIDPFILHYLSNGSHISDGWCQFLCQERPLIQFATLGKLSTQTQKDKFVKSLENLAKIVHVSNANDPSLLRHGLEVQIPVHIFVSDQSTTLHITVFYDRPGKYWWHAAADTQLLSKLKIYSAPFTSFSGIHKKVEIYPAMVDNLKLFLPFPLTSLIASNDSSVFKECNYGSAKHFYDTYDKDESDEAQVFRTKAWKILAEAKELLDMLNVPFWLSSGTCLGFHRQCDFIPYSQDVDIGIRIKDYNKDIVPTFSTHDLPLTHSFGKLEDSLEYSFRRGDIKLDIFFFYEESDHVWNGGTQARTGKKFKYKFPKFKLCWTEFLELIVRVPCDTETYVEANYGKSWPEPVKVWDWKKSPPNVFENGQWPIETWPEVIRLIPLPEQN